MKLLWCDTRVNITDLNGRFTKSIVTKGSLPGLNIIKTKKNDENKCSCRFAQLCKRNAVGNFFLPMIGACVFRKNINLLKEVFTCRREKIRTLKDNKTRIV